MAEFGTVYRNRLTKLYGVCYRNTTPLRAESDMLAIAEPVYACKYVQIYNDTI